MAERIEPALTPDQWAEAVFDVAPDDAFVIMARCNHSLPDGDPRKITHEHVESLRDACAITRAAGAEYGGIDVSLALALADILDSLLPPPA